MSWLTEMRREAVLPMALGTRSTGNFSASNTVIYNALTSPRVPFPNDTIPMPMINPLALIAIWFENSAVVVVAAAVGLFFLYCQAMILREAKGIPAWRTPQIVPLIVVTGLTEGLGLFLVLPPLLPELMPLAAPVAAAMLVFVAGRGLVWMSYSIGLRNTGAPTRSFEVLDAYRPWFLAFGLVVPAVAVPLGFAVTAFATLLFAFGGLSALVAGLALKFILVTRAGYNQGFALNHTPVRGSGIAGPLVKPGWILP